MYSCESCKKTFTGIEPYKSHLVSEEHKKKINEPKPISQDLENDTVPSTDWELERFIIKIEEEYKCTICKIFLFSVDQVKSHIREAKHLKAKDSLMKLDKFLSLNQNIRQIYKDSLSFSQMEHLSSKLYLPIAEIKESVKDMKVFQAFEEIKFEHGC